MSAGDVLRAGETAALSSNQIIAHVVGKGAELKSTKRNGSFLALFFITIVIAVFAIIFSSGNLIPSAISERIIEATDIQYADAIQSKILVFQQALKSGDVPTNTKNRLAELGVVTKEGEDGSNYLEYKNKTVFADDFYNAVNSDISLYDAFSQATYGRAAYYYDDAATKVFKNLGISRNNYSTESSFDETLNKIMGEGSNININSVTLVKRVSTDENGNPQTTFEYVEIGQNANSKNTDASNFVNLVRQKNLANDNKAATLYSAETLDIADTLTKEQRSMKFFVALMENISKMKAGEGSSSKITEVMNFLNRETENKIVDVETSELISVKGSPLQSPSLYSILSGEKIEVDKVKNYASGRVLKTIENKVGSNLGATTATMSSDTRANGTIARFDDNGKMEAGEELNIITPIIDSSLINNSSTTINGIAAGEFMVEGAVNLGKELAKASGATAGSVDAVRSYSRLTSQVLAMDAEIDRNNRSPFDITSKNTFLGSILYRFAISLNSSRLLPGAGVFAKATSIAINDLLPISYADDGSNNYLENFGDCATLNKIGAAGSATCSEIATFDISTLEGIFSDTGFINFINQNTMLNKNGTRVINKNSALEKFIKYSNGRVSPLGVMDGGILDSIQSDSSGISFLSNAATMISDLFSASQNDKRIATGEAFINSSSNNDWQTYKYAQRYVSLARATESLRKYSDDETAYSNLLYFEGLPVQRLSESLGSL